MAAAGCCSTTPPTVEAIAAIGAAHRPYGTTGFLPTLISDDLAVVDAAMRGDRKGHRGRRSRRAGRPHRGPVPQCDRARASTIASKFRILDDEAVALLSSAEARQDPGDPGPETTTPEMVRRLTAAGVIVAAGHTNAAYGTVRR